jgi:hypothetical protein
MTARVARRLAACALATTAAHLAWSSSVVAHEVGTTAVTATIDGRRYAVELTLDPGALVAKLDAAAGRRRSAPRSTAEYRDVLKRRADEILEHVTILFDDRPAAAAVETISEVIAAPTGDSLAVPRVCIRLTGEAPRGARTFRWSYDLTFATYPFIVKQADGPGGRLEWLERGQTSTPFQMRAEALAWLNTAGIMHVGLPLLLGCALVAMLTHPTTRRWRRLCSPTHLCCHRSFFGRVARGGASPPAFAFGCGAAGPPRPSTLLGPA